MSPLESATMEELIQEVASRHEFLIVSGQKKTSDTTKVDSTLYLSGSILGVAGCIEQARIRVGGCIANQFLQYDMTMHLKSMQDRGNADPEG